MKTNVIQILRRFGFTQSQADLFYAGHKQGPSVMAKLARAAGIPRTSAYYVMQELLRRGFFTVKKQGKRAYYTAVSGKRLVDMTKERERLVKKLVRYLGA
jgi:sugar-specific transcriptional regulator TrmB